MAISNITRSEEQDQALENKFISKNFFFSSLRLYNNKAPWHKAAWAPGEIWKYQSEETPGCLTLWQLKYTGYHASSLEII